MKLPAPSEPLPVCIVHWNRPEECLRTLDSFREQQVPLQITIVDNGSPADVLARLADHAPDARLIPLGKNLGFGPAANVALKTVLESTSADLVVLAPHDALLASRCLQRLLEEMAQHPQAGMASGNYEIACRQRYSWLRGMHLRHSVTAKPGWQAALYPHGTLVIFRRACLEAVGLFDERFFAYGEEQELGLRARTAGWEVGVVNDAVIRNPVRAASGPVGYYLNLRNSLLLTCNHSGLLAACVRTVAMLGSVLLIWCNPRRRCDGHSTWTRLRAIADFWRGRFGPPPADLNSFSD